MNARQILDVLEARQLFNTAFDLIGLTDLRNDPDFAGIDGSGVTVAVLDTGLDRTHIKLMANYRGGTNIADGGDNPVDREDHGTHVSGIVAAADPEIGVAPAAGLVGVKVLGDNGSGTFTDIRNGLRWVYDHRIEFNIQVVNMSLGGGFYSSISQVSGDIILPEIRRLEGAGITVVSAGGNSYKETERQNFGAPGIYSTLAVGAVWKDGSAMNVSWGDGAFDRTTGAGQITSFSQRLVAPNTIFAPGAFMRSTIPGNRYENMGGTSQASPVVAGSVALLQEVAKQFGGRSLSPAEVRDIIVATAVPIFDGDDEDDNVVNTRVDYQRLDIYAAAKEVKRRLQGAAPAPTPGQTVLDTNGNIAGAFLLNPTLDGSEPLTAAGRIGSDFGTSLVGATDVDVFKFSTASNGKVTIRVSTNTTTPEDFDTYLRLFNAAGVQVEFDDNSGGGVFSQLSLPLDAGTYFVGLSGKGNETYDVAGAGRTAGATGAYTITLSLANTDPNGTFSGAVEVNFGTDRTPTMFAGLIGRDYGSPVGTSDVDMFKIIAPDDGVIAVDIDTFVSSGFVDSYIRIFDEQGNELGFDDDSAAPDEYKDSGINYDVATGAAVGHATDSYRALRIVRGHTYYVAVSDFDNRTYVPNTLEGRLEIGTGGTYDIYIKFRSVDSDGTIASVAADPTLVFPFAGVLGSIGEDDDGTLATQVGDKDVDFYRFRVSKASLLEVEVDSETGGPGGMVFDSVLYLFDAQGNRLASNDDFEGMDPVLQFVIQANQDYFIAVSGFGNDSFDPFAAGSGTPGQVGDYFLKGRLLPTSSVKFIADDSIGFDDVVTATSGGSIRSQLGTDASFNAGNADVDLFKFVAADNGVLTVNADGFEEFSADTVLRVFDSGGKEIAFNDNRSDESRGSTVTAAMKKGKTYYIGVSGAGDAPRAYNPKKFGSAAPGSTGSYQVDFSYNQIPTLTLVSPVATADAGVPFTITYDMIAGAGNEGDLEAQAISFVVAKVTGGTLTKNGAAAVANQTRIGPGESLVWTPVVKASGATKAFTVFASDGVQNSAKAVQVSVIVNAAPTLTSVKDIRVPVGTMAVTIDYATLLNAANEGDKNRDVISFRIDSVLSGSLLLNGEAVAGGDSLLSPGGVLTFQPVVGATGKVAAFTVRAFDGRAHSPVSVAVNVKFG